MNNEHSIGFEIAAFSDLDYEGMTVEIRYQGNPVAQLSKDKGMENCEIAIPSRFSPVDAKFSFPVDDFVDAIKSAKNLLARLG